MAEPSLVRNATDREQVKRAKRLERRREEVRYDAYRAVLERPEGRLLLWDLVLRAGVFDKGWTASAEIHARAGRRDYGLELMEYLQRIDPDKFQLMEREWWERQRRERTEIEAAHTAASAARGTDDRDGDETGRAG